MFDAQGNRLPVLMSAALLEEDSRKFLCVILDQTKRQRAEAALTRRGQAERLLAEISGRFLRDHSAHPDDFIREALGELGRFTGIDRSGVMEVTGRLGSGELKHVWFADDPLGGEGRHIPPSVAEIDLTPLDWVMGQLSQGVSVAVQNLEELPEQATGFRALLEARGIRTFLATPMILRGSLIGVIKFSSKGSDPEWISANTDLLEIATEIIVAAEERARIDQELNSVQRELESRVVRRTQTLERSNRELETFSYSVSHDLRSPVRGIDGFSSLLLEDYSDALGPRGIELLERTQRASRQLGSLIDALLDLAKITRTKMVWETVNLQAVAVEVLEKLSRTTPRRMVRFVSGEAIPARGDAGLLRLMMEQLLGNAWKFTLDTADPVIELGMSNSHNGTEFFLRDNGQGFEAALANEIFQPFRRLHGQEEHGGHGIGLAIVDRVVRMHGGKSRAEGTTDGGAVIYITIELEDRV